MKLSFTALALAGLNVAVAVPHTLRGTIQSKINDEPTHNKLNKLSGFIPMNVVDGGPSQGWRPVTYISFSDNVSPVPVLVDTGSSGVALCPNVTKSGTSPLDPPQYGCGAYGVAPDYSGWVGEWYEGTATFGDGTETITDQLPMKAAWVTDYYFTPTCNGVLSGIMGVDWGQNDMYWSKEISLASVKEATTCPGDFKGFVDNSEFEKTMLIDDDTYLLGFVGLNIKNETGAAMCIGGACSTTLDEANSVGKAKLSENDSLKNWFTLSSQLTFSLNGTKSEVAPFTYTPNETDVNTFAIVDSGTQPLVLPSAWLKSNPEFAERLDGLQHSVNATAEEYRELLSSIFDDDATLTITIGDAVLEFPVVELLQLSAMASGISNINFNTQPVLGFPSFWYYDVLFNLQEGSVSFYERVTSD